MAFFLWIFYIIYAIINVMNKKGDKIMDDKILENAKGEQVQIDGWKSNEPLICILRRPGLLELASCGEIPNPLLSTAAKLFESGGEINPASGEEFEKFAKLLTIIAQKAMIYPTYEDIKEKGLSLTDTQLLEIYKYVLNGATAYIPFFCIAENSDANTERSK